MGGVPVISVKDADCVAAFIRKTFVEANEAAFVIELQNLLASCNTPGEISWNTAQTFSSGREPMVRE